MPISVVGAANGAQSGSSVTPAFGAGWAADDIHLIDIRVKATTQDVPATPAGYTDVLTRTVSGHVLVRVCARKLVNGDAAPLVAPSSPGLETMVSSITLRGCRLDSIANLCESAIDLGVTSATEISYSAATIATPGCMAVLFGTYGSTSGSPTFGTPTTLVAPVNVLPVFVGTNMRGVMWTDLQSTPASITAGGIPITTGSSNSNRGQLIVVRPAVSSTIAVTGVGADNVLYDSEAITISGSGFGASKGAGFVKVSPSNNIADGSAITQTTGTWGDTSITIPAIALSTFGYFTTLYLFVQNNAGQAATAFQIKREARFRITDDITNGGSPWASQSNINYRITASSINGTVLLSGSNESTDGSGILQTAYYTLTEGGPLAVNDPVWITLAEDNATIGNTRATCLKYVPAYE